MQHGVEAGARSDPEYWLFVDADIHLGPDILRRLVSRGRSTGVDLVSVMAHLCVENFWDQLLIPAFVFFFTRIYPFTWVNDPGRRTAGAAGGCMLVRVETLARSGGLQGIRSALIDDCALARQIKLGSGLGSIWLGFSAQVRCLRPYRGLGEIWHMVARTAFTQLGYSPALLLGIVGGMALVYLAPPIAVSTAVPFLVFGTPTLWSLIVAGLGYASCALMAGCHLPMQLRYRTSWLFGLLMPVTAALYTGMTVGSAWRHWRGRGGRWKDRTYGPDLGAPNR